MRRTYKYRIYPTKEQKTLIIKTFGCVRFIYNHLLSDKIAYYKENKKTLKREVSYYKNMDEYSFLKEVDSCILRCSIFDLEDGFNNFFAKRSGYPNFKSKFARQSYRTSCIRSTYKGKEYSNIEHIEKPIYFDEMLNICRKLSQEFPVFASIDFIGNDNEFYFEKFDFYSDELIHPFSNSDLDKELGSYIKIPSTKNEYLAFDNDIYLKTLIKYDEVLLKNISELNSIKLNNDEVYNSKLNEIKNKALELNRKIDELAWWIPIKSLRNKFRKKFKIADQTRPDQTMN